MNGHTLRAHVRAVLACAAVFAATIARAQDAPGVQTEPPEVVTANPINGFSERAALWPSNTLATDALENQSYANSLNRDPGLQVRDVGSPTVSIRGSASADRVLSLYDGVPLNLGDGIGPSRLFLPTEAIGSLQIFKGPASAFYGASAMAGAIDHRTRLFARPYARAGVSDASGRLGENHVFVAAPLGPQGQTRTQATVFYSRDPGRFPYTSSSGLGSGVRENDASDTSRATLLHDAYVDDWHLQSRLLVARQVGEGPGSLNAPYPNTYDNAGLLASLAAMRAIGEHGSISLRFADVRQWGLFDRDTAFATTSSVERAMLAADSQFEINDILIEHTFVDLHADTLAASYLGGTSFRQNDFDVGQQFEIALSLTLTLQPVVRYHAETGDVFKALGLVRNDELGSQWLTYSEGYRAPSLSDRFSDFTYFKGNRSLKPERSSAVETGFKFGDDSRDGWMLASTLFAIEYRDLFDTIPAGASATMKINRGKARANGTEIGASYGFANSRVSAGYAYLDAKAENGEPLRLSPRHQVSLAAAHRFAEGYEVEIANSAWSPVFDREVPSNAPRDLAGWSIWDLRLTTPEHEGWWRIEAGVLDLFDTPRELTYAYPEPQRRAYISAARTF